MDITACILCDSPLGKWAKRFCSSSCAAKHNNKVNPKREPQHKCKFCGASITCKKRYCSTECKQNSKQATKAKRSTQINRHKRQLKDRAVEYKGGCCILCGYSQCPGALVFHHVDPSKKEFSISRAAVKWESLVPELDKCVLLCMNCHMEVHAGLAELPTGI